MPEDGRVLSFPSPEEEALIAARLQALYAATPAADASRITACARAVLADAARPARATWSGGRVSWWVGAAAALALLSVPAARGWIVRAPRVADVVSGTQPLGSTTTVDNGAAVQFELRLPDAAREVAIVGDFNGWNERSTPMRHRAVDGAWSVRIPLAPGRHVYAFLVDGTRWLVDPLAPQVTDAGYGPANALVVDGEAQ